jgi:hypothetical protein
MSDVPEADAIEQRTPVKAPEGSEVGPDLGLEVPEADAIEQSQVVADDGDERRG